MNRARFVAHRAGFVAAVLGGALAGVLSACAPTAEVTLTEPVVLRAEPGRSGLEVVRLVVTQDDAFEAFVASWGDADGLVSEDDRARWSDAGWHVLAGSAEAFNAGVSRLNRLAIDETTWVGDSPAWAVVARGATPIDGAAVYRLIGRAWVEPGLELVGEPGGGWVGGVRVDLAVQRFDGGERRIDEPPREPLVSREGVVLDDLVASWWLPDGSVVVLAPSPSDGDDEQLLAQELFSTAITPRVSSDVESDGEVEPATVAVVLVLRASSPGAVGLGIHPLAAALEGVEGSVVR